MTLYRKRPVIVEAFQWQPDIVTMENKHPLPEWLVEKCVVVGSKLEVFTPLGIMTCFARDWVVQERNNLRIVHADIFKELYEVVDE